MAIKYCSQTSLGMSVVLYTHQAKIDRTRKRTDHMAHPKLPRELKMHETHGHLCHDGMLLGVAAKQGITTVLGSRQYLCLRNETPTGAAATVAAAVFSGQRQRKVMAVCSHTAAKELRAARQSVIRNTNTSCDDMLMHTCAVTHCRVICFKTSKGCANGSTGRVVHQYRNERHCAALQLPRDAVITPAAKGCRPNTCCKKSQ